MLYIILAFTLLNTLLLGYVVYKLRVIEVTKEIVVTKWQKPVNDGEIVVFNNNKTYWERLLETLPTSLTDSTDDNA